MGCAAQRTEPLYGVSALRRAGGLILSLVLIATPALGEPLGDDVARVQEAEHQQRLADQQAVTLSTEQFAQEARQQTLDRLADLRAQGAMRLSSGELPVDGDPNPDLLGKGSRAASKPIKLLETNNPPQ